MPIQDLGLEMICGLGKKASDPESQLWTLQASCRCGVEIRIAFGVPCGIVGSSALEGTALEEGGGVKHFSWRAALE